MSKIIYKSYLDSIDVEMNVYAFSYYISNYVELSNLLVSEKKRSREFCKKYKEPWDVDEWTEDENEILWNMKTSIVNKVENLISKGKIPIFFFPPTKPTTYKRENQMIWMMKYVFEFESEPWFKYVELESKSAFALKEFKTMPEREELLSDIYMDWHIKTNGIKLWDPNNHFIFIDDIMLNGIMYYYCAKSLRNAANNFSFSESSAFYIAKSWNTIYKKDIELEVPFEWSTKE